MKQWLLPVVAVIFFTGCAPTITKHVRVQRFVDKKPSDPFVLPLKNPKILSHFGERSKSFHTGIDLRGKIGHGELIAASRGGTVVSAGRFGGYGLQIVIAHPDGYKSRYAHLSSMRVKKGQTVSGGQIIGAVGKTGHATAPHLISKSSRPTATSSIRCSCCREFYGSPPISHANFYQEYLTV